MSMGQQEEKHVEKEEHFLCRGAACAKALRPEQAGCVERLKRTTEWLAGVTGRCREGEPRRLVGVGPCGVTGKGVGFTLRAMGAMEGLGAEGTWKVNCKKDHELVPGILHH